MNAKWTAGRDLETAVEDFAAELAEVAEGGGRRMGAALV